MPSTPQEQRIPTHGNTTNVYVTSQTTPDQYPFWIRAVWFLLIGWYLVIAWIAIALCFAVTIIGLPIAVWMFNRTNAVMTLGR